MHKLTSFTFLLGACVARAATSIDSVNHYAYGANIGWVNAQGDNTNGMVVGEYVCSGYVYSANVGWISLGNGSPTNSIQYQNLSANDFGVNRDGSGNLRGYAYGANIGWVAFESNGAPRVDLWTGNLSGYAYSANCGWISLSNTVAHVQTDFIQPAPLAPDGLPIPWLLSNFGTTNVDPNADPDHDGLSNSQEYEAGTDPNNAASTLVITNVARTSAISSVSWIAQPTRFYAVQYLTNLATTNWSDDVVLMTPGQGSVTFGDINTNDFYRVRAFRPLVH